MCTSHVWLRSSGRIAQGELQYGLKQLPVIRNREVGRVREVADTWGANGKIYRDCTKLAVLASCPLKRGGLKPSFHCMNIVRTCINRNE